MTREVFALVRENLSNWDPYHHPDSEIAPLIARAEQEWAESRERIALEFRLSEKQRAEREPIPDEWIAWDAALLVSEPLSFDVLLWIRHDGYETPA